MATMNMNMNILELNTKTENVNDVRLTEEVNYTDSELREIGSEYCSHGDKVYADPVPKVFKDCNGVFMYDSEDTPYLDLEMWVASCK